MKLDINDQKFRCGCYSNNPGQENLNKKKNKKIMENGFKSASSYYHHVHNLH